ncbi:Structural maintenance of chromosomes protein 3, partial [Sticta canariensis]|nr:Structural maintenance of chromosomes protein 3 [Sticta canariensis]
MCICSSRWCASHRAALTKRRTEEASAAAALEAGQQVAREAATKVKENAHAAAELRTEVEQLREQLATGDLSMQDLSAGPGRTASTLQSQLMFHLRSYQEAAMLLYRSLDKLLHRLQDEAKRVEALMTKRTALQAKRADLEKAVRELGTLPADAFEKYREHSMAQLHKLLTKAQNELKKFGPECCVKQPAKHEKQRGSLDSHQLAAFCSKGSGTCSHTAGNDCCKQEPEAAEPENSSVASDPSSSVCVCRSVNKKALDQFQSFASQREELVKRTRDNDASEAKIRELIGTLDLRKDEAIERTFK